MSGKCFCARLYPNCVLDMVFKRTVFLKYFVGSQAFYGPRDTKGLTGVTLRAPQSGPCCQSIQVQCVIDFPLGLQVVFPVRPSSSCSISYLGRVVPITWSEREQSTTGFGQFSVAFQLLLQLTSLGLCVHVCAYTQTYLHL